MDRNKRNLVVLAALAIVLVIAFFAGRHFLARSHYNAAQEALERRDFRTASVQLQKFLDTNPNDAPARLLAARTARRQGDFSAATAHLKIYVQLGQNPGLEQQLLILQQGDLRETGPLLDQCRASTDGADTSLILEAILEGALKVLLVAAESVSVEEGELAAELARAREALELWQRLRSSPVDQAQGLIWRARLHQVVQNHAESRADLRKALELAPEYAEAKYVLAQSLFTYAPDESVRLLQELHDRYPEDRSVTFSLGSTRRHLGQLEEAGRLFDELIAASPQEYSYLLERGYVAMNAGQLEDAERWLRRAHALAPKEPFVNLALSGCLRRLGREAEAQVFFDAGKKESDERILKKEELSRKYRATGKKS